MGAVTVVILFGIMFTQKPQVRRYRTIINRQSWWASSWQRASDLPRLRPRERGLGLTEPGHGPRRGSLRAGPARRERRVEIFVLLFEVASVLLLVAIVAAIVISRRKTGGIDRGCASNATDTTGGSSSWTPSSPRRRSRDTW